MSLAISSMILVSVFGYLWMVHAFYRKQQRFCATFPYYRLRDRVIWEILENPEPQADIEQLYGTLNKIVHEADAFGWKFISNAVMVAMHAFLDQDRAMKRVPSKLERELAKLVVQSAKDNSLIVRLAFSRFGGFLFIYPVAKALFDHLKNLDPQHFEALKQRLETLRGVRRLEAWSHSPDLATA